MRSKRYSGDGGAGSGERVATGRAPGRDSRTHALPVQMKRDGAGVQVASPAPPSGQYEDPFALHLLGTDACAAPLDKEGHATALESELERLIEMAEWSKLRPAAYAAASTGAKTRAKERRETCSSSTRSIVSCRPKPTRTKRAQRVAFEELS